MRLSHRIAGVALALTMSASAFVLPIAAQASEEGKRNTTYALGAAAAALLLTQKNKLPGIVAAAGAGYAYTKYNDDVKSRHRRERDYGYDDSSYNRNDRNNNDRYNNDRYNRDNYNNSDYRNHESSYNTGSDDPNCRSNGSSNYRNGRNNRYDNSAEYGASRVSSRRGR